MKTFERMLKEDIKSNEDYKKLQKEAEFLVKNFVIDDTPVSCYSLSYRFPKEPDDDHRRLRYKLFESFFKTLNKKGYAIFLSGSDYIFVTTLPISRVWGLFYKCLNLEYDSLYIKRVTPDILVNDPDEEKIKWLRRYRLIK